MFQHYTLPNGRQAHFFNEVSIHELDAPRPPPPPPPLSLVGIAEEDFPDLPRPLGPPESWKSVFSLSLHPPSAALLHPPTPTRHTLPVAHHNTCTAQENGTCEYYGVLPDALPSFSVSERTETEHHRPSSPSSPSSPTSPSSSSSSSSSSVLPGGGLRPPYEPPVFLPRKGTRLYNDE